MPLTILHVAYPLAPVGPDAAGGAEQVLTALDAALVAAGHRSLVVACAGSRPAGELIVVPRETGVLDEAAIAAARLRHAEAVAAALRDHPEIDVVHMHGIDFHAYLPPPGPPVLATLHAPFSWYAPAALHPARPRTVLTCVSAHQHRSAPPGLPLLDPIPNGVPVEALRATTGPRGRFALFLGRIAPEKGVDLALDAAHRAGCALAVAGELFPYPAHQDFFARAVAPRLDRQRRYLGPAGFRRKRRLLNAARCLLLPARLPETSSLVAREAMACGAPVIAYPAGALAEVVEPGRTGFLVETPAAMAEAIRAADRIDPETCRRTAASRFGLRPMIEGYLAAYDQLARGGDRPLPVSGLAGAA
ncbi:glycosyltransferase [Methylobacterium nodulans]|uniref:Glycosyl transferase group 1 n=1 Tax=Methylobacterium nodulans (strain LMG 21967 / CNCM I-2342 / ORS 2060) TaxID=460265 RepID=B8IHT5_METNO|nr:glycosyltransferase [Methylobacterium nodulans]ACL55973.1 glycosyl transferase group 1 [Methylobacterium nodulans ORS 2060]